MIHKLPSPYHNIFMDSEARGQSGKYLNARVTETSHDTWRNAAEEQGVSVTGLLKAMALEFPPPGVELKPNDTIAGVSALRVIKGAREIDAHHRNRRRSSQQTAPMQT
jgi:hypothetical protein